MRQYLFFLIPDEQLYDACQAAASLGYYPQSGESRISSLSDFSSSCVRFNIDHLSMYTFGQDRFQWLVLLPLSWPELHLNDLELQEAQYSWLPGHAWYIWTVPLAEACTAWVRIICAETRTSSLRERLITDLINLLSYNLYSSSREEGYWQILDNDVPLSESELLEVESAVATINSWEMRDGEEWIKENLIKIVSCTMVANQLPWKEVSESEIPTTRPVLPSYHPYMYF